MGRLRPFFKVFKKETLPDDWKIAPEFYFYNMKGRHVKDKIARLKRAFKGMSSMFGPLQAEQLRAMHRMLHPHGDCDELYAKFYSKLDVYRLGVCLKIMMSKLQTPFTATQQFRLSRIALFVDAMANMNAFARPTASAVLRQYCNLIE